MNYETELLINVIDEKISQNQISLGDIHQRTDLESTLKLAINNRILYCFTSLALKKLNLPEKEIKMLIEVRKEGKEWLGKFQNTLNYLNDKIGSENYVVIKTFKYYQDVTFDVDIILKSDIIWDEDFDKDKDFYCTKINGGYELKPKNDKYLAIDIYDNFLFRTKTIFSKDFVSKNLRKIIFEGQYYTIPSIEAEMLLYISQLNFQLRFITLHDFLQVIKTISENKDGLNWNSIFEEVEKYNWKNSFVKTLSIINALHLKMYGETLDIPVEPLKNIKFDFPYIIHPSTVLTFDFEVFRYDLFGRNLYEDFKYFFYEYLSFKIRQRIPIYRPWIDLNKLIS